MRFASAIPSGCFKSIAMPFLLRLNSRVPSPGVVRDQSPVRGSTLKISAPKSPSVAVASGAAPPMPKQTTRTPSSAALAAMLVLLDAEGLHQFPPARHFARDQLAELGRRAADRLAA